MVETQWLGQVGQVVALERVLANNKGWVGLNSTIVISDILPTYFDPILCPPYVSISGSSRYAIDIMSDVWVPPMVLKVILDKLADLT